MAAVDFSKFDKKVDKQKLAEQIKEAKQNGGNEDLPAGDYLGKFEKFEVRTTKDGRPMFSCQFRILGTYDGDKLTDKYKNKCVFMNRVVYGTKNDGNMINSLLGWLEDLGCEDIEIFFDSYEQLNDLILDIAEDIDGVQFDIEYSPDAFNNISVIGEAVPF